LRPGLEGGVVLGHVCSITNHKSEIWSYNTKAYNTFKRCEYGIDLWIRGEPTQPLLLSFWHKKFMKKDDVVCKLGPLHTDIIQAGKEYFQDIKE